VSASSSSGGQNRPSLSTTAKLNPANRKILENMATVGARLPASIRATVLCGISRYLANSR